MKTDLNKALAASSIGSNYKLLGFKSSFCAKKRFLSYSDSEGWKVVRLNIFKQFARNFFGCYESTHLEHVVKKLGKTNKVPKALTARMDLLWKNTYPHTGTNYKYSPPHNNGLSLFGNKDHISSLARHYNKGPVFKGLLELDKDYKFHKIAGDGHCLFRSIAAGIALGLSQGNVQTLSEMTGQIEDRLDMIDASDDLRKYYTYFNNNMSKLFAIPKSSTVEDLMRNKVVSDRMVKFLRLLACEYNVFNEEDVAEFLPCGIDDYVKGMKKMHNPVMGGHIEIQALVEVLGLDITLLDVDGYGKGGNSTQQHYKHTGKNNSVGLHLLYLPLHYNLAVVA